MGTTLVMMLSMAVGSSAILAVAVSAPDSAPDIGVSAAYVGIFTGIVYFVSMFSGSFCAGFIVKYGPVRVLQFTGLCSIAGLSAFALSSPAATLLCALLLGIAYGPINPANAPIMLRVTERTNRAVFFSIKQSGVTFGGAAAALLVPFLADWLDWRFGIFAVAMLGVISILILQLLKSKHDDLQTGEAFTWSWSSFIGPVTQIMRIPLLRGFAMVGFTYAGVQISVSSFFVVYLVDKGFTLVEAGLCFLFVNIGGILGRVAWGGVTDKLLSPKSTLTAIGIVSAISLSAIFLVSPQWYDVFLYLYAFIIGASTHGWNGVFLSEIATQAPKGESHNWTGGVQFVIYAGVAILPPVFGGIVFVVNEYTLPFILIAIASFVASFSLLWLYQKYSDFI